MSTTMHPSRPVTAPDNLTPPPDPGAEPAGRPVKTRRRGRTSESGRRRRANRESTGSRHPRRQRVAPLAGLVVTMLAAGLVLLLMVNNSLAAGSFAESELNDELALLTEQREALEQEVLALSSPAELRTRAEELGMLPAASAAYLDLESGKILGTPLPAGQAAPAAPAKPDEVPDPEERTAREHAAADGDGAVVSRTPTASEDSDSPAGDPAAQSGAASESAQDQGDAVSGDGARVEPSTAQERAIISGSDQ